MSKPKPTPTGPFVQQLRDWLTTHPGEHSPVDIARDMGVTTHTVAARLLYLSSRGEILRRRTSKSSSRYSAARQ